MILPVNFPLTAVHLPWFMTVGAVTVYSFVSAWLESLPFLQTEAFVHRWGVGIMASHIFSASPASVWWGWVGQLSLRVPSSKGSGKWINVILDTSYLWYLFNITHINCSWYLIQISPPFLHRLGNCTCAKPPPGPLSPTPVQIASPDSCAARFQTAGRCRGWCSAY